MMREMMGDLRYSPLGGLDTRGNIGGDDVRHSIGGRDIRLVSNGRRQA